MPGTPNSPAFVAVTDDEFEQFDLYKAEPGVAAWNDFSKVSAAASQSLREAAGISVPKREFVLWMVGAYLVLIVPINWLVFRLLGRVEWAWIAVPFFAVGWGVAVIWLAQLNIGFARAETEVAVLELQPGFPASPFDALHRAVFVAVDELRHPPGRADRGGPAVCRRVAAAARPDPLDRQAAQRQ